MTQGVCGRPLPAQRLASLRSFLRSRPEAIVDLVSLAERFEVSTQTIRRDLAMLEADGVVQRTFGGAVIQPATQRFEPGIEARRAEAAGPKAVIGRAAQDLLIDGEEAYFDASTTVLALVQRVPEQWSGNATTSSVPAAQELSARNAGRITLLGGEYRRSSQCVGGSASIAQIAHLRFTTAYLSCRAFSLRHGLTEARPDEAALKRAVIEHAQRIVMLVDSSKIESVSAHHFADLLEIDILVVDDHAPAHVIDQLRNKGVNVILAPT